MSVCFKREKGGFKTNMQHRCNRKPCKKMKLMKETLTPDYSVGSSHGSSSPSFEKMVKCILGCRRTGSKMGFSCKELVSLMKKRYKLKQKSLQQHVRKALSTLCSRGIIIPDSSLHPIRFHLSQRGRLMRKKEKLDRLKRIHESSKRVRKEINKYIRHKVAQSKTKRNKHLKPRMGVPVRLISKKGILKPTIKEKLVPKRDLSVKNLSSRSSRHETAKADIYERDQSARRSSNRKSRRDTSTRRSKFDKKMRKLPTSKSGDDKQYRFADVVMSQKFLHYLYKTIDGKQANTIRNEKAKRTTKQKKKQKKKTRKTCKNKKNSRIKAWRLAQSKRRRRRTKRIERRGSYRNSL